MCSAELKEEVVYYDTCEDPVELQSLTDQAGSQRDAGSPTLGKLNRRLQQLETKRGAICARRAYLRNKKVRNPTSPPPPPPPILSIYGSL